MQTNQNPSSYQGSAMISEVHLKTLINDTLKMSRIESGEVELKLG